MTPTFALGDIIGMSGVCLLLLAYFFLQTGKLKPHDLIYLLLNMFGSIGILVSLKFAWNLSSAVIQVIWILISLYGIYKHFKNPH